MSYSEDDLLPLSALQHLVFCERQCALIHIEQVWRDNPLTLEGSHLHDRTHETAPRRERRGDLIIARGLHMRSLRMALSGIADVVEFHRVEPDQSERAGGFRSAIPLPGASGEWRPFPVEYKRGKPKPDRCDEVQLCAQGMCIEEMLGVTIPCGALFYGAIQRRHDVQFDAQLRTITEEAARRVRELIRMGVTPRVRRQPKCKRCSLIEICRPDATQPTRSAKSYFAGVIPGSPRE